MRKNVFISYKAEEVKIAEWIYDVLEKEKIHCWMAPRDIPGGSNYAKEIPCAIKECDIVVVLVSRLAQKSEWIPKEINRAISAKKRIMPFVIEECVLNEELDFYLSNIHQYKAYLNADNAMKNMIHDMKILFGIGKTVEGIKYKSGTYKGELKRGVPHGQGMLVYEDGAKYTGCFVNGELHGNVEYRDEIGIRYQCKYDHGRLLSTAMKIF